MEERTLFLFVAGISKFDRLSVEEIDSPVRFSCKLPFCYHSTGLGSGCVCFRQGVACFLLDSLPGVHILAKTVATTSIISYHV